MYYVYVHASTVQAIDNVYSLSIVALSKMEELLLDMKQDAVKLSMELSKCPSVSQQLKIDELSILSKLAGRERKSEQTPSVITSATTTNGSTKVPPHNSNSTAHTTTNTVKPLPAIAPSTLKTTTANNNSKPAAPKTAAITAATGNTNKVTTTGNTKVVPLTTTGNTKVVPLTTQSVGTAGFGVSRFSDGTTVLVPTTVGGVAQTNVTSPQVVYWTPGTQPVAMVTNAPPTLLTTGGVQFARTAPSSSQK